MTCLPPPQIIKEDHTQRGSTWFVEKQLWLQASKQERGLFIIRYYVLLYVTIVLRFDPAIYRLTDCLSPVLAISPGFRLHRNRPGLRGSNHQWQFGRFWLRQHFPHTDSAYLSCLKNFVASCLSRNRGNWKQESRDMSRLSSYSTNEEFSRQMGLLENASEGNKLWDDSSVLAGP